MIRLLFSLIILTFVSTPLLQAQDTVLVNSDSRRKINALISAGYNRTIGTEPLSKLIMFYSDKLVGTPYKAGLLDQQSEEKLLVDIRGLDCVTYIEHVMALGQTTLKKDPSFSTYMKELSNIRYIDGKVDGYTSRLHYFSDWMLDKSNEGSMTILFQDHKKSVPLQSIYFMSANWEKYPRLKENPDLIPQIEAREAYINSVGLRYIPKEFIEDIIPQLQDGDIVSFVTKVKGLDVTHTGIVKVFDDHVTFYHASTTGEVKLEPKGLSKYVQWISSTVGVMIARVK